MSTISPGANHGQWMHQICKDLFPINRSITGEGVRQTLSYIKNILPQLEIFSVPSGTHAFDWVVPEEWDVKNAFIKDSSGKKIVDFKENNLHLVGYSCGVDNHISLELLQSHLFSLPNQPKSIPYVTSYYKRTWGFCISHEDRLRLKEDKYHVYIDANHFEGNLNYGELIIPGSSSKEILLSTYVCHPSMANNELSGPAVTIALAQWLSSLKDNRYTYRIIFIPETIGSLVYLSKNIDILKANVVAGYNITCVGDERAISFLPRL